MLLGSIGNPKNHLFDIRKDAERNRNIFITNTLFTASSEEGEQMTSFVLRLSDDADKNYYSYTTHS